MTTWLVLGSSVSAPEEYQRARPFADVVVTANRGVKIEPNPDWLWCSDNVAFARYRDKIDAAIAGGAKLLTNAFGCKRAPGMREIAHTVFSYPTKFDSNWRPGEYMNGRASGGMILQFAANQQPDRILMVGMEGYQSTPGHLQVEYFDGELGAATSEKLMDTYGPLVQSVIDQSPEIEFWFFGKLHYPWRHLNVVGSELTAHVGSQGLRCVD